MKLPGPIPTTRATRASSSSRKRVSRNTGRIPASNRSPSISKPGAAWEPLAGAFRARFSPQGEFTIYSNRSLRDRILTIFDQTFAVTYILRTVAVVVAITGVFLAVTTLAAEREREIGVLRAIGASRAQVRRALVLEAGMMGAIALRPSASPPASVLAMALTWVVNPAFFGWTITLQFPSLSLVATPILDHPRRPCSLPGSPRGAPAAEKSPKLSAKNSASRLYRISRTKLSGVPSAGFTKITSLGSRRGVSIARNTTGSSKIFGSACTVPRLKTSNSPGPNSATVLSSSIQNVPRPENT